MSRVGEASGDMATAALILSGGVAHPFAESSAAIARLIEPLGIVPRITTDVEAGLVSADDCQLMVFNLFRDRHFSVSYPCDVPDADYSPAGAGRAAVINHLARGGGLLALHGAVISFADWEEWAAILGAGWIPDRSGHPKRGPMEMDLAAGAHPVTAGIASYRLDDDEPYGFLDLSESNTILARSRHGGVDHPMLWLREYSGGRIAYLAPCHGVSSLSHPAHREVIRRTVLWLLAREDEIGGP